MQLVGALGQGGEGVLESGDMTAAGGETALRLALVAGGGVKGGTVIGSSSTDGQEVRNRPVLIGELYSTLLSMLRINPVKENKLAIGRAIKMADSDEPVTEMFI